jgi:hypothetical protein
MLPNLVPYYIFLVQITKERYKLANIMKRISFIFAVKRRGFENKNIDIHSFARYYIYPSSYKSV